MKGNVTTDLADLFVERALCLEICLRGYATFTRSYSADVHTFLAVYVQKRKVTDCVKRRRPLYRRTVGWIYGGDGERHRALPLTDCDERRSL